MPQISERPGMIFFDALYGEVTLSSPLSDLARSPVVQRLRDIRLSNIDSLSMPGIANITRFEHALGTAYLAGRVGFGSRLASHDSLVLRATAMLHDAAITALAHLVEEALRYIGAPFDHEQKLAALLKNPEKTELGGIDLQIYLGHQAGIRAWAQRSFGGTSEERLSEILEALRGRGRWGKYISSDIDLDNLDNLVRIAYHMGLPVDRGLPVRISEGMGLGADPAERVFSERCIGWIQEWLDLRWKVYSRLMLSQADFAGKAMLIYAVVTAYSSGDLGAPQDVWLLTDRELLERLVGSKNSEVSRTTRAWFVQDVWPLSDLLWMEGTAPPFARLVEYSEAASRLIGRPCFGYRIQDKRVRLIRISIEEPGHIVELGSQPTQWLLGVTSRRREAFSRGDNDRLREAACEFFQTKCQGRAGSPGAEAAPLFS